MFQVFMNHIFADMLQEKWLKIYMDDLGIHTKDDIALHHEHTQQVLQHLQEHRLSIKLSKCVFDAPRMEFLGMIIRQEEIKMDEKKLEAIKEWKPPTSVKGIRSFTGFANFYWKFIPDFPTSLLPLTCSLIKENPGSGLNKKLFNILSHTSPPNPKRDLPLLHHD